MTQSLGNPDKFKMMLSGSVVAAAMYCYVDFVLGVGDVYPEMLQDEIMTGLLGLGLALVWYRFRGRR
ncbi:hypothetical protein [Anaeroselena agilis]|uniref:Uncharacterized protein n=1 Tax=Anaeroselena agilis TaxID=3063788 RepID=A0ABU3P3M3_9FIRM|nr:hypothetical protein [Selenomonadales bacterium 4137-cl]